MEKNEIFEFIDKFNASGLSVFEYSEGDVKLRLEKALTEKALAVPAVSSASDAVPSASLRQEEQSPELPAVESPIVGVFYKAPAPGSEPFVEVGGRVSEGQVMCIIEAMKMMNEIKAPFDCTVRRVLAVDGEMVDCGMKLFEVEKC